jgi:chemotaxis protein MotB
MSGGKDTKESKIVIKKVKKIMGGGHHGGSWKVAYADFVTAMMAFFLMMWLLNMASPVKRAQVSRYFKYFTIFDKSGWSLMADGQGMGKDGGVDEPLAEMPELSSEKRPTMIQEFEEKIKTEIAENFAEFKDQIVVIQEQKDLRIEIMDTEGTPIFPLSSAELNPNGKKILAMITEKLQNIPNKIVIEGHTDALGFAPEHRITNWELSIERASAARRELENSGLDTTRLDMVVGYAATRPIIKDAPQDPRNRRISIVIMLGNSRDQSAEPWPDMNNLPQQLGEKSPRNDQNDQEGGDAPAIEAIKLFEIPESERQRALAREKSVQEGHKADATTKDQDEENGNSGKGYDQPDLKKSKHETSPDSPLPEKSHPKKSSGPTAPKNKPH